MKINGYELSETKKNVWQLKPFDCMKLPGKIYGDKVIIGHLTKDVEIGKDWNALKQVKNVACLPGLQTASFAMPDVHPGYGFPIGGVGAFDTEKGVISLAGVGYDVNCGVRTMRTCLTKKDVIKKQKQLLDELFKTIPAGLGITGKIKLTEKEIDEVLVKGAEFSVERGYGSKKDLEFIEENGKLEGADPSAVSALAKKRQLKQIGTLGSGNHYLEVQYVDEIHDEKVAKAYKLEKDQVVVSLHCGSRALGHQVGTDYGKFLAAATKKYKIKIPDNELVCAPFKSPEGQKYYSAVIAAINCAFANREALAHLTRKAFAKVFGIAKDEVETLYEIGHNTCKVEKHKVNGKQKKLIVHRKGATRAFGPGREEIPKAYQKVGQPVLVGGTMGTWSWILHGTETGMKETFGSACHGAGRLMSRKQAKKSWRAEDLVKELAKKGILVKGHGWAGLAEEAPGAYKDVDRVVNVSHNTGIAKKVAKVKPLVVVKG